jgi:hypothetical protein
LPEAGALACIRLLVASHEQARQRRVGGAGEKAAVTEKLLRLVERLERAVGRETALVCPPFLELREGRHPSVLTSVDLQFGTWLQTTAFLLTIPA